MAPLLYLALAAGHDPAATSSTHVFAGVAFVVGNLLFSGSLWVLAASDWNFVGYVTPLGGLAHVRVPTTPS